MTAWLLITIAALRALAWAACFATLLAVAAIEAHWRARNAGHFPKWWNQRSRSEARAHARTGGEDANPGRASS
jgi:hypothetical protein